MGHEQLDQQAPEPLYRQLAMIIRRQIERGDLAPGALLPSESYLMGEYGVSRGTVRKAVQTLRHDGLVITAPQRGTFVKGSS